MADVVVAAPSGDRGADRGGLRAFFTARESRPYVLLPAIPLAIALELAHAPAAAIFSPRRSG